MRCFFFFFTIVLSVTDCAFIRAASGIKLCQRANIRSAAFTADRRASAAVLRTVDKVHTLVGVRLIDVSEGGDDSAEGEVHCAQHVARLRPRVHTQPHKFGVAVPVVHHLNIRFVYRWRQW